MTDDSKWEFLRSKVQEAADVAFERIEFDEHDFEKTNQQYASMCRILSLMWALDRGLTPNNYDGKLFLLDAPIKGEERQFNES